jgi:predicted nucleotidyltransferase
MGAGVPKVLCLATADRHKRDIDIAAAVNGADAIEASLKPFC